jgi:hypothetical protein
MREQRSREETGVTRSRDGKPTRRPVSTAAKLSRDRTPDDDRDRQADQTTLQLNACQEIGHQIETEEEGLQTSDGEVLEDGGEVGFG